MVGKTVTSLPCSATPWYRIIRACSLLTKHAFHQYEKARFVAKLKVARERKLKLSVSRQRPSYMRTFAACVWSRSRSRKGCASPRLSFNRIETHCGFCAFMGPSVPSRRSPTGR